MICNILEYFFRKPEFVPNFLKNLNNWNVAFRVSSKFVPNLGMEPSEFLQSFLQTWNETLRVFFKVCSKPWNGAFKVCYKL